LAAVQALYQSELTGLSAADVVAEFVAHRFKSKPGDTKFDQEDSDVEAGPTDTALFGDIVEGTLGRVAEIDGRIGAALKGNWTPERLERILLAILRCGVYELLYRPDVPGPVILSEYVDIAYSFFDSDQPSLANGVLDTIAKDVRSADQSAPKTAAAP
jgi:N utilization substance protein B